MVYSLDVHELHRDISGVSTGEAGLDRHRSMFRVRIYAWV